MLKRRYLALASFVAVLILSLGLIVSGLMKVVFFPDFAGDFVRADLEMNEGTPSEVTHRTMDFLNETLKTTDAKLQQEYDLPGPIIRTVFSWSGSDTTGGLFIELTRDEDARVSTQVLEQAWRDEVGQLPGVRGLRIGGAGGPGGEGPDLSFQLVGNNIDQLQQAAKAVEEKITEYAGTFDIRNSYESGLRELQLTIQPQAEALGLTQQDLARQVRQAFFGEEVQRIQRGQDDVRVMVRYPKDQRTSQGYLENMRIRAPTGEEVPFSAVASLEMGSSPTTIRRFDRERSVNISARVDKDRAEPGRIANELRNVEIPKILANYPSVDYRLAGQTRDQQEIRADLLAGTALAFFLIYALLAIPLKSYAC
jgi:multidrug efflux pump subunit AcrB